MLPDCLIFLLLLSLFYFLTSVGVPKLLRTAANGNIRRLRPKLQKLLKAPNRLLENNENSNFQPGLSDNSIVFKKLSATFKAFCFKTASKNPSVISMNLNFELFQACPHIEYFKWLNAINSWVSFQSFELSSPCEFPSFEKSKASLKNYAQAYLLLALSFIFPSPLNLAQTFLFSAPHL